MPLSELPTEYMNSKHAIPSFQGSFEELCAIKSGKQVPIDKWNETQARLNKLNEQSYLVAKKLEEQGIQAFVENDMTVIGLHSGMSKQLEGFRNITFIPSVAKMRRAPEVKFVQYCLQEHQMARAWTITSGPRVIIPKRKTAELGALSEMAAEVCEADHQAGIHRAREKFSQMTRRISRLNSESFMKEVGAEFTYWSKEFGEVVETDDGLSIHPHLHAVLIMKKGAIQKHRWSNLLKRIQAYLGAYSKDCGIIQNPREFVKYCVKPDDLTELPSSCVADLYQVTRHMRMQQPLGEFRNIKRDIKENDLVLTHLDGKLVTMRRPTKGISKKDKPWKPPTGVADGDPVVVARIEPAPVFSPITEPLLLVHGLDGRDISKWVLETEPVQELIQAIRLHTKSLIVRRERKNNEERKFILDKSNPKIFENDPVAN